MHNRLTRSRVRLATALCLLAGILCVSSVAMAESNARNASEPVHDADGNTQQKIKHQLSPEIYLQNPFSSHSTALLAKAHYMYWWLH